MGCGSSSESLDVPMIEVIVEKTTDESEPVEEGPLEICQAGS
jgi:hypothetical protein